MNNKQKRTTRVNGSSKTRHTKDKTVLNLLVKQSNDVSKRIYKSICNLS